MNYYQQQVASLNTQLYSNTYLIRQMIHAKHFIELHHCENISIDRIAKDACISKFHLIRSFRKVYGRTPIQFLTDLRIRKAKELLTADVPVAEVCYSIGLASHSSFTGFFKKFVGHSPSNFKKKLKKSNIEEGPIH